MVMPQTIVSKLQSAVAKETINCYTKEREREKFD
jgi:hypothetical protein